MGYKKLKSIKDKIKPFCLYQKENGAWIAEIYPCLETDGKKKRVMAQTKYSCTKKVNAVIASLIKHSSQNNDLNVKDYFQKILPVKKMKVKPSTYDRFFLTVEKHVVPVLGEYKVTQLTRGIIQDELIGCLIEENYSMSSITKALQAIRWCCEMAISDHILNDNPALAVELPSQRKIVYDTENNVTITYDVENKIKFYTEQQIANFSDMCTSKLKNGQLRFKYGLVFLIMLNTGIRQGEILALHWSSVDTNRKIILVKGNRVTVADPTQVYKFGEKKRYITIEQDTAKTKSSTNRQISLNDDCVKYFNELKSFYKDIYGQVPEYVVAKDLEHTITTKTLSTSYKRVASCAGIPVYTLHSLRHTFATMMFLLRVPPFILAMIMGHTDERVTREKYIHVFDALRNKKITLPNLREQSYEFADRNTRDLYNNKKDLSMYDDLWDRYLNEYDIRRKALEISKDEELSLE